MMMKTKTKLTIGIAAIAIIAIVLISGCVENGEQPECISGDDKCPEGCTYEQDSDCPKPTLKPNLTIDDVKEQVQDTQPKEVMLDANCDAFPDKLDSCAKYKCQFTHPFTGEPMVKEILGVIDGKCNYVEEMPNDGKLECKYTESMRKAAARYYKDLGSGEVEAKYTIDGKEVANPLQEAVNSGQCTIYGECYEFPDKLDSCTKYKCKFTHLFTGETMVKEILGVIDGKCNYVEEMPNDGKLECKYTESMRKAAAQYYKDLAAAESFGTSVKADLGSEDVGITYTIDGKEVENPLQEATNTGQCIISGYDISESENKCPPGTEYKGETYSYENGNEVAHPICSDPNVVCPPCENCISGNTKKVISLGEEVCYECSFDEDCKEDFHCYDNECLSNDVLINLPESCEGFGGYPPDDPCQEYTCEGCEKGHKVCQGGWSNWPSDMRYKCIECDDSFNECIRGYKCEEYKCVVE